MSHSTAPNPVFVQIATIHDDNAHRQAAFLGVTMSHDQSALPAEIRTARLLLRSWQPDDAGELLPILESNWKHLSPWIPARVATPAPEPVLAERLATYAANFVSDKEWRYAIVGTERGGLFGEVALFPRSDAGRVSLADADRAELGYWLREDENGHGFATEAAAALLAAALRVPRFAHVEIRCDSRNLRSAAVPGRLGFSLMDREADGTQVFVLGRGGLPVNG